MPKVKDNLSLIAASLSGEASLESKDELVPSVSTPILPNDFEGRCNALEAENKDLKEKIQANSAEIDALKNIVARQAVEISRLKDPAGMLSIPTLFSDKRLNDLYAFEANASQGESKEADGSANLSVGIYSDVLSLALPSQPVRQDDEAIRRRKINQILSRVPSSDTRNPISALVGFCKNQLGFATRFVASETSDGMHTVQVHFPGMEIVASATGRTKKTAQEIASRSVLVRFEKDSTLLHEWMMWSLEGGPMPHSSAPAVTQGRGGYDPTVFGSGAVVSATPQGGSQISIGQTVEKHRNRAQSR